MIAEELEFRFNIRLLQNQLLQIISDYPKVEQSNSFGGWSVLSGDGSYVDGWQKGHYLNDSSKTELEKLDVRNSITKSFRYYTKETEICSGYLKEVIEVLRSYKLNPSRARIIELKAGKASVWHRDAPDHIYAVRMHIPIITNQGCLFVTNESSAHMEANGSAYLIWVNCLHRVINTGSCNRYHLVMDVIDTNLSNFHKINDLANRQV